MGAQPEPATTDTPRRSFFAWLRRWAYRVFFLVIFVVAILLVAGFLWERSASASFEARFPPPGEKVTLEDGHRLHFVIRGEGEPTLILESGGGGPHLDWDPVIDRLAEVTRVVAYDRAGLGWSDSTTLPRDSKAIVGELHEALDTLGIDGPKVMAGHSLGGLYVRHYTALYPEDIVGLVLVDASHEDQMSRMPEPLIDSMAMMTRVMGLLGKVSRVGVLRAMTALGVNPLAAEGASAIRTELASRGEMMRASVAEYDMLELSDRQVRDSVRPLGDMPVLVLTADELADPASQMPSFMAEHYPAMREAWLELQADLAGLSTNSRHLIVPGAGHYVHHDNPDVVVAEVTALIDAIRAGRPLDGADESAGDFDGADQ